MSTESERLPLMSGVSEHSGRMCLQDPDGSTEAWVTCDNPMEVRQ